MSQALAWRLLVPAGLILSGGLFSWRLLSIPSRVEAAAFLILFFLIPTLKYPKFGVYYLFCMPFFVPVLRRLYYLIEDRPAVDYLMLISDGVMGGFICALALLMLLNKERVRDAFPALVVAYTALILFKVFAGTQLPPKEGLYGFKFHGLYIMFFFAGSYVLTSFRETRRLLGFVSWILLITALYGIKQILFGFAEFEQKWLDSIAFTTLRIEGVVRPFSTYVSPATLADGMVILLITGLYWFISKGRHLALFGILLAAASIWPLLIATVRTNWLAAAAGIFFYCVYLRIRKGWAKGVLMACLIAGAAGGSLRGGGGASQYESTTIQNQLTAGNRSVSAIMIKNRTQALANPLQEYSVQKRLATWYVIWHMVLRHPFGAGTGTTGYAHSYYFQILGETGFPGLLLYLALLTMAFRRGFRILARCRDPEVVEMTRYFLTLIFMFTILNLTGTHLHTPPGDLFFFFAWGCIHRFHRRMLDREAEERIAATPGAAEEPAAAGARPADPPAAAPAIA